MKYLFLVVFVTVAAKAQSLTKEEVAKLKEFHEICQKESGVDPSLVKKALKGEYVDDSKLKSHIFCCTKKLGFQNEAGDILEDALIQKLTAKFQNEAIVKSAVKQCSQKKASPTETGFELTKCLHSMAPQDMNIASLFF